MFRRELLFSILLTCFYLPFTVQRSTPEDDFYVAGVVEYVASYNPQTDLAAYEEFAQNASLQNVDILVFPEMTLAVSSPVPVPINGLLQQYPVPDLYPDLYHEVLVRLSRQARLHGIYIVANFEELLNCTVSQNEECPEQKEYLFNTNVVFDRNGAVIDRYRKINLFGERTRTPSIDKSLGIFTTDFGVRMGHFICFDLQFQVPSIQLVQRENISDIIFTTMWFSELPYLTAVEIQEAYAYAANINLIASGASRAAVGSAGSGIYSGKAGALVSLMPGVNTRHLLVAKVPKIPGQVTETYPGPTPNNPAIMDNLFLIRDPSLSHHISVPLVENDEEQIIELEDDEIKCHFVIKMQNTDRSGVHYTYRATAFNGVRSYSGVGTGGSRLCSVIACTDAADVATCGSRFQNYVEGSAGIFEHLTIIAEVPTPVVDASVQSQDSFYYPISLRTDILPLLPNDYAYSITDNQNGRTTYTMSLVKAESDLITFAVWGRVFGWDNQPETIRESSGHRDLALISIIGGLASLVLMLFYRN